MADVIKFIGILCFSIVLMGFNGYADEASPKVSIQSAARPIDPHAGMDSRNDDLEFLDDLVQSARLVSFGEAMHGANEFLRMRNRIFKYLVENKGFTAIVAETGYLESLAAEDFIQGHGELNDDIVASVFSFNMPEAMAENRTLLQWMRHYNSRTDVKRKLHFYGLEMLGRSSGEDGEIYAEGAFAYARDYVQKVDPEAAEKYRRHLSPPYKEIAEKPYGDIEKHKRDRMSVELADFTAFFVRRRVVWTEKTSPDAYERAYRNALNARALDADYRANGWWRSRDGDRNQRDATSARNLRWVMEREGPEGRVFAFAHTSHIKKGPHVAPKPVYTSMGEHLKKTYGDDMVVIGSMFAQKRGFGVFDTIKNKLSPKNFATQLQKISLSSYALLFDKVTFSDADIAALWDVNGDILKPVSSFDALIFFETVTPAR